MSDTKTNQEGNSGFGKDTDFRGHTLAVMRMDGRAVMTDSEQAAIQYEWCRSRDMSMVLPDWKRKHHNRRTGHA